MADASMNDSDISAFNTLTALRDAAGVTSDDSLCDDGEVVELQTSTEQLSGGEPLKPTSRGVPNRRKAAVARRGRTRQQRGRGSVLVNRGGLRSGVATRRKTRLMSTSPSRSPSPIDNDESSDEKTSGTSSATCSPPRARRGRGVRGRGSRGRGRGGSGRGRAIDIPGREGMRNTTEATAASSGVQQLPHVLGELEFPEMWESYLPNYARGGKRRAGRKRKAHEEDTDDDNSPEEQEISQAAGDRVVGVVDLRRSVPASAMTSDMLLEFHSNMVRTQAAALKKASTQ